MPIDNPSVALPDGPTYQGTMAGPIDQGTGARGMSDNVVDEAITQAYDVEQNKMMEFNQARIHLDRLIRDWATECEDTDVRRKTRDVEIDVEGLRQKGDLDEDETIIPVRVIDVNISRELPPYVNYLKNSRRLMTFRSLSNPNEDPQLIEQEYTRGMTYSGWENNYYKALDGACAHGWSSVEVVFDATKPLNVGIEYVAHDELFWPRTVKNIQDSPRLIRAYDVTIIKLKEWVRDFGFSGPQVQLITQPLKDTQKENETRRIYKLMFKKEGVVWVGWFSLDNGVNDWLKKPEKLFVGIYESQQVPVQMQTGIDMFGQPIMGTQMTTQWKEADVKQYPFFKLPYRESEKPKAVDNKGRVFLDENKQEAQTAILSGYVNGITRASNIYASPSVEDGSGSALKELENLKLCGGRILSKPMTFWAPPYPDAQILRALQYFDVANSEETNQVSFASMNREDSRKTATEIGAAQQTQQTLNSVQLTLFSTFIREVNSFAWLIVQSQALQGFISFLLTPQGSNPDGSPIFVNNQKLIEQKWELRSAGDVDVIQRQEKIQQMMQDWPIIANTPLAMRFLCDLLKLKYPDVGDQYTNILMAGNPVVIVQALATVLAGVIQQHPEILQTMPPEQAQQLTQMLTVAQQMTQAQQGAVTNGKMNPQQQAAAAQGSGPQPAQPTTESNEQPSQNIQ